MNQVTAFKLTFGYLANVGEREKPVADVEAETKALGKTKSKTLGASMTRRITQLLAVLLLSFALFFSNSAAVRATILFEAGQGIPNIEVGLKKKPGGHALSFNLLPGGGLNLGQLSEGSYTLTIKRKEPPPNTCLTCKSFYESRSNTTRAAVVVNGTKGGPLSFVIDLDKNMLFNTKTFAFEPLGEVSFDVEGDTVVTGAVAFAQLVTPTAPTQTVTAQ